MGISRTEEQFVGHKERLCTILYVDEEISNAELDRYIQQYSGKEFFCVVSGENLNSRFITQAINSVASNFSVPVVFQKESPYHLCFSRVAWEQVGGFKAHQSNLSPLEGFFNICRAARKFPSLELFFSASFTKTPASKLEST